MKEYIVATRSKYYHHIVEAESEKEAIEAAREVFEYEFNNEADVSASYVVDSKEVDEE